MSEYKAATVAAFAAAFAVGQLVAGKAVRDALLLTHYPVTVLPALIALSALLALLLAVGASRLLSRFGPARVVPLAFVGSALLHLVEALSLRGAPDAISLALYLHVAALGPVLVSGLWLIVSERFDPRAAKRVVGRIAAGGALGGVVGGVLSERVTTLFGLNATLPLLVVLALGGAAAAHWVAPSPGVVSGAPESARSARDALRDAPHLAQLAVVVVILAVAQNALDYVLKAEATAAHETSAGLLRFFALYHVAVGLATFAAQSSLSRRVLESWGLSRTAACLPAAVVAGGAVALGFPTLANVAALRGLEAVTRNSLFRSAYEVFFTPLPPGDKRSVKTLMDVGAERLGDVTSGGVIRLIVVAFPLHALSVLLASAVALAGVALLLTSRLGKGYVRALEHGLVRGDVDVSDRDWLDKTTRLTLTHLDGPRSRLAEDQHWLAQLEQDPGKMGDDDFQRLLALLGDSAHAAAVVRLLRTVADGRVDALRRELLDSSKDVRARRLLPRVLCAVRSRAAASALTEGLFDERFAVRFQCGRALYRLTQRGPGVELDSERILAALRHEIAASRAVLHTDALGDELAAELPVERELISQRASRTLEHVFRLLTLVLPRDPVLAAYRCLDSDDPALRGNALEYLDTVLPESVRRPLWPYLELEAAPPRSLRNPEQLLRELLKGSETIRLNLSDRPPGPAEE